MMKYPDTANLVKKHQTFIDHRDFEPVPDDEIISRVLNGEKVLFEILIRRYNQQLYRILRSYLPQEDDIREAMQTAYLKAYEKLDQFKAKASFSTWLIRIAINEALKLHNRSRRFADVEPLRNGGNGYHDALVETENPEQLAVRSDMKRLLEQTIDTLPAKYRSVFVMREIEQMDTKETAECLGITRVNVKVRLYRAKKMLRGELEKRVTNVEIFEFKGVRCDRMVRKVMGRLLDN